MSRLNRAWWKKVVACLVLTGLFATIFIAAAPVPKAQADIIDAMTTFTWQPSLYIKVEKYNRTENTNGQQNFSMSCTHTGNGNIGGGNNGGTGKYICENQKMPKDGGTGPCGPQLLFVDNSAQATFVIFKNTGDRDRPNCVEAGRGPVNVLNTVLAPPDLKDGGGNNCAGNTNCNGSGQTGAADPTVVDPELDCGEKFSLNWVLCPAYYLINKAVSNLDDLINRFLNVDQVAIFDYDDADPSKNPSANGYHNAWRTFRNFSLALIVIAALIMIVSSALGFQILDAYTLKKVVPRLALAAIGISLSWDLMRFLVTLTNDLGLGIRQIIYSPFAAFDGSILLGGGSAIVSVLIGAGALVALGVGGLLSFAATAGLAIFVAFLVLMIRQLVIIVLILFAPIAIACSILPNTQGMFKLWYESFTKALLMFPIIVAFISIGRVFAMVAIGGDITQAKAVSQIIGFAAYFLPYFLIPMTFSLAGGAMRFVGGQINDRNRGGFDRLKKYRAGKIASNMHDMKTGDRFGEQGMTIKGRRFSPGGRLNNITRGLGTGIKGRMGLGTRGLAATSAIGANSVQEFMKTGQFQAQQDNDPVLQAAAVGRSRGQAIDNLQSVFGYSQTEATRYADQAASTIGFGAKQQQAAAMQLVGTGTGYANLEQMSQTLALASGGNSNTAMSMAGFANNMTKSKGRFDLAPSFGTLNTLVQSELGAVGPGGVLNKEAGSRPGMTQYHQATVAASRGANTIDILRGKRPQVEYFANSLQDNLESSVRAYQNTNLDDSSRAAALEEVLQTNNQIRELKESRMYAGVEIQNVVNNLNTNLASSGYQQQVDNIIQNDPRATARDAQINSDRYANRGGNGGTVGGGPTDPNMPWDPRL